MSMMESMKHCMESLKCHDILIHFGTFCHFVPCQPDSPWSSAAHFSGVTALCWFLQDAVHTACKAIKELRSDAAKVISSVYSYHCAAVPPPKT